MHSFYNHAVSKKVFYAILFLFGAFYLYSLVNRYIEDDEAVLGEYSYYFLRDGVVRWKTMPGILDFDTRVYPHHRFFTWTGAAIIKIFGWSIHALKTSMLFWYAAFFFLLYKYFHLTDLDDKKRHFIIGATIIFTAPIILLKSFSFRPDVLLMAEGMGVLYFLKRFRVKGQYYNVLLAGGMAGLGFLTHLNGVAFCVAGFFFLLIFKEFKAVAGFTIAGALVGGLYFVDLLPQGNFDAFIYQLTHWPTVNHGENYIGGGVFSVIMGRITKLLSEHQRFFWGEKVMAFSILFFIALIFNFRKLKVKDKESLYFILLLIPALNIFGSHVAERYLLFYYGPMCIISAIWICDLQLKRSLILQVLTLLILSLHLVFAGKMLMDIKERSYDTTSQHKRVLDSLNDKDAKILAPYAFIFDELENYDLYAFKTYEYMQEDLDQPMSQDFFFSKANELGMDYIIVDQEHWESGYMKWMADREIDQNPYYKIYADNGEFIILGRN